MAPCRKALLSTHSSLASAFLGKPSPSLYSHLCRFAPQDGSRALFESSEFHGNAVTQLSTAARGVGHGGAVYGRGSVQLTVKSSTFK